MLGEARCDLLQDGVAPDSYLYSALFAACAASEAADMLDLALRVQDQMLQDWQDCKATGKVDKATER